MKFTEDMIGKHIREISTGDTGVILSEHFAELHNDVSVMVHWNTGEDAGKSLHIRLESLAFIGDTTPVDDVIVEIAGVKYKLVPL